jgi:hypothetical protein
MPSSPRHLEGIARDIWESVGSPLPVDAFTLADALDLQVRGWPKSMGARAGALIRYPTKARAVRQHMAIAHEIGHWAAEHAGIDPQDEHDARYLGGALMLPWAPYRTDMERTDWDLFELQTLHPNVSAEAHVVRMTQISPATASVWDCGKLHRWYGADQLPDYHGDATVADRVLEVERPIVDGLVRAWPVFDGRWRRVIVLRRAA